MKSLNKIKIASILICALILNQATFAGQFFYDNGVKKYLDDDGTIATGWRWLDTNNDNICECYRFGADGALATRSRIKGKDVNQFGQWVVDGVVQQVYYGTGTPLYSSNAALGEKDTNEYLDFGTASTATRRINATSKDIKAMMEADAKKDSEDYLKSLLGPKATFTPAEEGYILSRGATAKIHKVPVATVSSWKVINTIEEETVTYLTASQSIVAGKDMRDFVDSSNKYTASVNGVKIYGGDVWDDAMVLQGNGAYVKFKTTKDKTKFQANYLTFEVAHQTHGEATADTYCAIELYLNGKSVAVYDEFCDGEPENIEEWLDDGETTVQLKAIVTGDAPGRKIYIRNARFRQIKYKEDDD